MTKSNIELQAEEFYNKVDLDKHNLTPEQRAEAEEMLKALSLVAAGVVCGFRNRDKPNSIDESDWNDLESLLKIGNDILSDSDKRNFIQLTKKYISEHSRKGAEFYILTTLQSMIKSRLSRNAHENNVNAFEVVDGFVPDETEVTPEEFRLLYKINKQPFPGTYLPGYFSYEYQLDIPYSLNKLIYLGYLLLVPQSQFMSKLTCDELRNLLADYGLPTKGKKDELIDRVYANIHTDEIDKRFTTKYFITTDKWKGCEGYARLQG